MSIALSVRCRLLAPLRSTGLPRSCDSSMLIGVVTSRSVGVDVGVGLLPLGVHYQTDDHHKIAAVQGHGHHEKEEIK